LQRVALERVVVPEASAVVPYTGPATKSKKKETKEEATKVTTEKKRTTRSVSVPKEKSHGKAKQPVSRDVDEEVGDAGEWQATLESIAAHMGKNTACIAKLCPNIDEDMVGAYIVYMQTDGIHFMQITKYNKDKKHNVECKFLIGEDEGKLLNYELRAKLYKEDPSELVGDWGVVLLA
jgi:hypothetical protein